MKRKKQGAESAGLLILYAVRAALLACIATTALVLLAAFFLKWEWVQIEDMHVINTLIKTVSASFAGFMLMRMSDGRGVLYAGISGLLYIMLSYVVFLLIEQDFTIDWGFLSDAALCVVASISAALIRNTVKAAQ